jgi:hypothetical protein
MSRALLASAKHKVLSISGQSKLTTLNAALAGDDVAECRFARFCNPVRDLLVPMSQGTAAMKNPSPTVSMADKVALIDASAPRRGSCR